MTIKTMLIRVQKIPFTLLMLRKEAFLGLKTQRFGLPLMV